MVPVKLATFTKVAIRNFSQLLLKLRLRTKVCKTMITDYDVFCLRNNILAMLYQRLYEVLFQGILLIITHKVGGIGDNSQRKISRLKLITSFD